MMKKNATTTIEEIEYEQQALSWLRVVCIHLCELTMNLSTTIKLASTTNRQFMSVGAHPKTMIYKSPPTIQSMAFWLQKLPY